MLPGSLPWLPELQPETHEALAMGITAITAAGTALAAGVAALAAGDMGLAAGVVALAAGHMALATGDHIVRLWSGWAWSSVQ